LAIRANNFQPFLAIPLRSILGVQFPAPQQKVARSANCYDDGAEPELAPSDVLLKRMWSTSFEELSAVQIYIMKAIDNKVSARALRR
jgi:hypothetical protein